MVVAFTHWAAVAHDDGTDGRIRRGAPGAARGQLVGALQEQLVRRRQLGIGSLHGSPLFATAMTTACSTSAPASRNAAAQSRSVEPVVQTSSNRTTRFPAMLPA